MTTTAHAPNARTRAQRAACLGYRHRARVRAFLLSKRIRPSEGASGILMHSATGSVDSIAGWRATYEDELTHWEEVTQGPRPASFREWQALADSADAPLVEVVPNLPGMPGYDSCYGKAWRPAG